MTLICDRVHDDAHFSEFRPKPFSTALSRTFLSTASCSLTSSPAIRMSSRTTSTPGISSNISVIVGSHTSKADYMPKGICVYLNRPNAELNVGWRDVASVTLIW